jgi:hypothetical protein
MPIYRDTPVEKYRVKKLELKDNTTRIIDSSDDNDNQIEDETREPVKRKSRLTTPRPKNAQPAIRFMTSADYTNNRVGIHHEPELAPSFKEFARKSGIRFTSYEEYNP